MSDILNYRIPARLREMHTFIELGPTLEHVQPLKVITSSLEIAISDQRFLTHPLADAAVLVARGLLFFLGITVQGGSLQAVRPTRYHADDLKMRDLGLSSLSVSQATQNWQGVSPARAETLLLLCILAGNKVSAHLTKETATSINASFSELAEAFNLVINLVNREVYDALSLPRVEFVTGSVHGSISKMVL
ncbi:hypothetical protein JNB91_18720 [Rhizobium wenxiniae]|uniref:hypothetical protein n=1 Tax=Rhizobium wenxiniae TaxID=1737357 RepID=UPI001C6EAE7F|nr:hypothetical protein [Rhizobium wenxiniae]MBW9089851.1 hypothetical protein [Rhizobium wenxiniae]